MNEKFSSKTRTSAMTLITGKRDSRIWDGEDNVLRSSGLEEVLHRVWNFRKSRNSVISQLLNDSRVG